MRGTAPIFEDSNNSNLGLVLFNKGAKQQRQHRSNDSPRGVIDECVSIFRITQNIEYTVWSCACVACPSIRLLAACPMSPRHPDWMSRDRPFHYTRTHIVQLRKKGRLTAPELIVFRFCQWLIKHSVHSPVNVTFLESAGEFQLYSYPALRYLIRNWRPAMRCGKSWPYWLTDWNPNAQLKCHDDHQSKAEHAWGQFCCHKISWRVVLGGMECIAVFAI